MDPSQKAQLTSANIVGTAFGIATLWCAWKMGSLGGSPHGNILLCIVGALFGWILGILASPLDRTEESRLKEYGRLISVFATGYVVSKLDRFLEYALFTKDDIDWTGWIGVSLFSASMMSVLIPVFVNRSYWHAQRKLEKESNEQQDGNTRDNPEETTEKNKTEKNNG